MSEVRVFTYPLAQRMNLLYNVYVCAAVVPCWIVLPALSGVGWWRYVVMGIVDAVVLVVVALMDHRVGNRWPTTIQISGNIVVLSRLWEYDRFDLSNVHWVEDPIDLSKRVCFRGSSFTTVEYESRGKNHTMWVNVNIDGYAELLAILSSLIGR